MLHFGMTIFLLLTLAAANGQSQDFDRYRLDTIHLEPFTSPKIVAFKANGLTFYVDHDRYQKAIYPFWKNHHLSKRNLEKEKKSGAYRNPEWDSVRITLDSIYSLVTDKSRKGDTLFLFHYITDVNKVGFYSKFFAEEIEKNRCSIQDIYGNLQPTIIRQKGSRHDGPLKAWGGRRFYLPGQLQYFLEVGDWYS